MDAFFDGQRTAVFQFTAESAGLVGRAVLSPPRRDEDIAPYLCERIHIIRQFHHAIKDTRFIVAPDVKDVNQTRKRPRNRHRVLDALELAFERAVVIKGTAENNFDGVMRADGVAREPDFAVTAAANLFQ